jgi:O-antigen ligase
MVLDPSIASGHRKFWAVAVIMGCMGVVLSQSRGVYGLLIWVALASYVAASNRTLLQMSTFRLRTWLSLGLLFGSLIWMLSVQPAWLTSVIHRLSEVWIEASMSQSNPGEAANTSVGSRLFLWSKALDAIEAQPWFGYGKENSIAMIKQWGLECKSWGTCTTSFWTRGSVMG